MLILSVKNISFVCYPLRIYDVNGPNKLNGKMMCVRDIDEMKWVGDVREALIEIERLTKRRDNANAFRILYSEHKAIFCIDMFVQDFFEQLVCLAVIDHCRSRDDYMRSLT